MATSGRNPTLAKTWVFLAAVAFAASGSAAEKAKTVSVVDFPFPSGLRVVFLGEPGNRSVTIAAVIANGSADDPAGKEGVAHLTEHMWFRSRPGGGATMAERLNALGGTWNAFTDFDETTFYATVPRDSLSASLKLFGDLLTRPLEAVAEADLVVEREVVRNELRQRTESTAPFAVHDALTAMVFPEGHRYHRSIVGSHASLDAITLDDLKKVVERYRPDGTTIVVTSDLDPSLSGAVLKQSLPASVLGDGTLVPRKSTRAAARSEAPPAPSENRTMRMKAAVTRPKVYLAWSAPGGWREEDPALEVAVNALEDAVGEYLYPDYGGNLRSRETTCSLERQLVASLVVCEIDVGAGQDPAHIAKKAIDGVFLAPDRAIEKAPYLRALRGYMREIFYSATASRRALSSAAYVHYTGRVDRPPRLFTDLRPPLVDARKVQTMSKLFSRKRAVTLIVDPGGSVSDLVAQKSGWVERTVLIDAVPPPADRLAGAAVAPDFSRTSDVTLANGLRIVVHPHPVPAFARVTLFLRGGFATSVPAQLDFFSYLDWKGDALDVSGVWTQFTGSDSSTIALDVPSGEMGNALAMLRKRIKSTKSDFERATHKRVVKINSAEENADTEERRLYLALYGRLFPEHSISRDRDWAAIGKFDGKLVSNWIERKYAPGNATLLVVGDVDPATVQGEAARLFGDWRKKDSWLAEIEPFAVPAEPRSGLQIIDQPGATQTAVFVACRIQVPDAHARTTAEIAATMLGQDANRILRETQGATYGLSVYTDIYPRGAAALIASSWVQNDAAIPAARLLLERFRLAGKGETDEVALRRAQWTIARASHVTNENNWAMTGTLVKSLRLDKTIDEIAFSPAWIAKTTKSQIADVLRPCNGREIVVLVGPAIRLAGAAETLGLPAN